MDYFDLNKYLGTWYELMHYPSWFQRNDNYNTTAKYIPEIINGEAIIKVYNSTITQGKYFESVGIAKYLGGTNLRVDFPVPEISKLQQSGEFNAFQPQNIVANNFPNYVINKLWYNANGEYVFAVVTDPERKSLYVLSRYKNPSLIAYNDIMTYVIANFDRDRLVQTPHFD